MSRNTEIILDQIVVIKLDINLWTSSKKLRKEDLVLGTGSKLPPEDLAFLGTKKTINPENLKEFQRIKKEAERICLEKGTRFLGGFANPRDEIPRITQQLDDLTKTFRNERNNFLANYEAETKAWIAQHAEFGDAIRRAVEPVESVAAKLRFDYVVFRVSKADSDGLTVSGDSLDRRTHSMSDQLFHEIAQDANDVVTRSFVGKESVTGRVLNAFRRMRNKLNSLGFLDHRCMPVVDEIDAVLETLPKAGPYSGSAFHDLFRLGMLLSDPYKIKQHGGGLLQLDSLAPGEEETDNEDDSNIGSVVDPALANGNEVVQMTFPDIVVSSPDESATGEQPVLLPDNDDDLPDFDVFLSNYGASKEGSLGQPSETDSEQSNETNAASGFMDKVKETVKTAAARPHATTPVYPVEDGLDTGSDNRAEEPEPNAEKAEDFWF
ncbi:MAG: DUF3150 domain-containing protein [Methyloglobulus sp.]